MWPILKGHCYSRTPLALVVVVVVVVVVGTHFKRTDAPSDSNINILMAYIIWCMDNLSFLDISEENLVFTRFQHEIWPSVDQKYVWNTSPILTLFQYSDLSWLLLCYFPMSKDQNAGINISIAICPRSILRLTGLQVITASSDVLVRLQCLESVSDLHSIPLLQLGVCHQVPGLLHILLRWCPQVEPHHCCHDLMIRAKWAEGAVCLTVDNTLPPLIVSQDVVDLVCRIVQWHPGPQLPPLLEHCVGDRGPLKMG